MSKNNETNFVDEENKLIDGKKFFIDENSQILKLEEASIYDIGSLNYDTDVLIENLKESENVSMHLSWKPHAKSLDKITKQLLSITFILSEYTSYTLELTKNLFEVFKDGLSNINNSFFALNSRENNTSIRVIDKVFFQEPVENTGKVFFDTTSFIGKTFIGNNKDTKVYIQINPKIENSNIYKMMNYMYNARLGINEKEVINSTHLDYSNLYFLVYLSQLSKFVNKHLARDYIEVTEEVNGIKGRINFGKTIQNIVNGRKHKVVCNYFELSVDNLLNRVLYQALLKVRYYSNFEQGLFSKHVINKYNSIIPYFHNISRYPVLMRDIDSININLPKYRNYRDVFPIARNILRNTTISLENRKLSIYSSGFSFFLDMNILFEDYVYALLQKDDDISKDYYIYSDNRSKNKYQKKFLSGNNFQLKPDIIMKKKDNGEIIIADTKYKKLNSKPGENYNISPGDMYQMISYMHNYDDADNVNGVLIYPEHEESPAGPLPFELNDGNVIKIIFVDINDALGEGNKVKSFINQVTASDQKQEQGVPA